MTLVDGFGIPHAWKNAAVLDEEARRQEAMHREDTAGRTKEDTAVTVAVPPGQ